MTASRKCKKMSNSLQYKSTKKGSPTIKSTLNSSKPNRKTYYQIKLIQPSISSISSNLFKESLEFARQFIQISDDDLPIMIQTPKTLLFKNITPQIKKTSDEDFEVPMGYSDNTEVYELVGTYIQNKLTNIINTEYVGLYCDNGLGIF